MKKPAMTLSSFCGLLPLGLAFFLWALLRFGLSDQSASAHFELGNWRNKADAWVWQKAQEGRVEFLLFLREQADLSGAKTLSSKTEKGWYVYRRLTEVAERTQAPLLEQLRQRGVRYRSFWVANMVWVRGGLDDVIALAQRKEVARIVANPVVQLEIPRAAEDLSLQSADGVEWNLRQVNADAVWQLAYFGQGVVIGGQDTGYDWQHPALKNAYRGWDGSQAKHDYHWHDAIHEPIAPYMAGEGLGAGADSCPYNSPYPCDDNGHGTHTMGTMVGLEGSNQIGMAPQAKWIGCRNMDRGRGTPATYAECFQWFIAPTKIDGSDPDPSMAPDVINNSWSCPEYEGCSDPNVLKSVVEAVRAAGILTVQSAGNEGPNCATIRNPGGIYAASFTVGATNSADIIADFSSRGPVTVDGSNRQKPDVVAPGVGIRSSYPGSRYVSLSGTSMAAPHVVGLAALVLSVRPYLKGQVDFLEEILRSSAMPLTSSETCGEVLGSQIPNNTYGWGRIDAWRAVQIALTYPLYVNYFPLVSSGR
ncbi:MAG: S8 family serine peptidase [Anaerolineales bacterium]|nr:S8 family serine peptidase [Anaerolineales bacterium]MDW8446686.1 S8 family serine peptidase [Anaerolineales bacterium]